MARSSLASTVLLGCLALMVLEACAGRPISGHAAPDRQTGHQATVVAAGDIASCGSPDDEATARLLGSIPGTVLTLGDNAYEDGSVAEYAECYDPTWGRFEGRTRPAPGNHEYSTPGAAGYFGYFGKAAGSPGKGYYSYDLGEWHVISLNSIYENVGGCGSTSPMLTWLKNDLAANPKACTLAYFHYPLFSSGNYAPGIPEVKPLWEALYSAGADVVLNGHDHNYQRFAPQDPDGRADPDRGIREFVVGTGGASHYPIEGTIANAQIYNDDTFGVLKLTLNETSYEWKFVPVAGKTFTDSGTTNCH